MTRATKNTSGWNYGKPDIDDSIELFESMTWSLGISEARRQMLKKALYDRLAAEAVILLDTYEVPYKSPYKHVKVKAVPLSKLKAIMEIKDENS